jgi:hypothetical protein
MPDYPLHFLATYECTECHEFDYELKNCLLEDLHLPCEVCRDKTLFHRTKIIHGLSF